MCKSVYGAWTEKVHVVSLRGCELRAWGLGVRWTHHPVIVTIMDNKDYIRVLLYSYYTTITGWGVLLRVRRPSSL